MQPIQDQALRLLSDLHGDLRLQAFQLADRFAELRTAMVLAERDAEHQAAMLANRRYRNVWANLAFVARHRKGYLYLEWDLMIPTRQKGKVHHEYIARSDEGHYDLRTLAARAAPVIRELVIETEQSARPLREKLRELLVLRRTLTRLLDLPQTAPAPAPAQSAATAASLPP